MLTSSQYARTSRPDQLSLGALLAGTGAGGLVSGDDGAFADSWAFSTSRAKVAPFGQPSVATAPSANSKPATSEQAPWYATTSAIAASKE